GTFGWRSPDAAEIGEEAAQLQIRKPCDLPPEFRSRKTGSDTTTLRARVEFDHDPELAAGLCRDARERLGRRDRVDRHNDVCFGGERSQAAQLFIADDGMRDENLPDPRRRHHLCFTYLCNRQTDCAQFELASRGFDGLVSL